MKSIFLVFSGTRPVRRFSQFLTTWCREFRFGEPLCGSADAEVITKIAQVVPGGSKNDSQSAHGLTLEPRFSKIPFGVLLTPIFVDLGIEFGMIFNRF